MECKRNLKIIDNRKPSSAAKEQAKAAFLEVSTLFFPLNILPFAW